MTKIRDIRWAGCPIRYAAGVFGDKWSLLIIRDLMFKDRRYFGEFLKSGEGISTNILADKLAHLVKTGIVAKQRDPANRSKIVYILTEKGLALMPVMLAMMDWSDTYDEETEVPELFSKALKTDRLSLQKELLESIEAKDRKALEKRSDHF